MTTTLKSGRLSEEAYGEVLGVMTQLNRIGASLAGNPHLHAMTDVTGFRLLGHLAEVCRGSGVRAVIDWHRVPIMPAGRWQRKALSLGPRGGTGTATSNRSAWRRPLRVCRNGKHCYWRIPKPAGDCCWRYRLKALRRSWSSLTREASASGPR